MTWSNGYSAVWSFLESVVTDYFMPCIDFITSHWIVFGPIIAVFAIGILSAVISKVR